MTLRDAVLQAHATFKLDWKGQRSADLWLRQFENHILRKIGARSVAEVSSVEILNVLEPLYHTRPSTARRLRKNLRRVFAWAMARGLRDDNPAGERLDGALPRTRPPTKHHRAVHHSMVKESIGRVRSGSAAIPSILAFELILHTASRTMEVLRMRWADLDPSWNVWMIPAEDSKDSREHRKPITRQVRSMLRVARAYQELRGIVSDFVLASPQGKTIGESTLRGLLRLYGIPHSVHGLRASFRGWGAETGERWDVMEMQLSHAVGDPTIMAYYRTDLLEQRAETMQRWSNFLDPGDYWSAGLERLIVPT